ncbi:MAG: DUF1573 domain-containing protein [Nitrospirota bacterium]
MRSVMAVLFIILALFGSPASAFAGDPPGPRIHVGEGRFDFGTVAAGSQPEHIFEIKNTGDEVLEIQKVQPT